MEFFMKKGFISTLFIIGLIMIGAGISNAQTANVAGEWEGQFNTPGGARPFKLVFEVDGEKLSGKVLRSTGDVPVTGTIKGDKIEFSYSINYGGNALTMFFTGTVSGDSMGGNISFGGQADESWSAKRAAKQ